MGTGTIVRGTKISGSPASRAAVGKRCAIGIGAFGDEHQLLAALRVGHGHDRMLLVGPELRHEIFDGAKRHHLARDLREAFRAPLDRHEALGIELDDVAGVVPAVSRRLEHAWLFSAQVSEHHVRAVDEEPAARVDALDSLQPMFECPAAAGPRCPP